MFGTDLHHAENMQKFFQVFLRGHDIPYLVLIGDSSEKNICLRQDHGTVRRMTSHEAEHACRHPGIEAVRTTQKNVVQESGVNSGADEHTPTFAGVPLFLNGLIYGVLGIMDPNRASWEPGVLDSLQDFCSIMTEQKLVEELLLKNESMLLHIFGATNSLVLIFDKNLTVEYMNDYAKNMLGYTEEEYTQPDFLMRLIPEKGEFNDRFRDRVTSSFLSNLPFYSINPNIGKDGRYHWISWSNTIIGNSSSGTQKYLSIGNDITELRNVQSRFDLMMKSVGFGMWDFSVEDNVFTVDDTWRKIRGVDSQESFFTLDMLKQNIHPDDFEIFRQAFDDHSHRITENIRFCCRCHHPEKGWFWIRVTGKITERDPKGNPLRVTGFDEDITEQIHSKVLLNKQQELLHRTLQIGKMGYYILDCDTDMAEISPTLVDMLRWKKPHTGKSQTLINYFLDQGSARKTSRRPMIFSRVSPMAKKSLLSH